MRKDGRTRDSGTLLRHAVGGLVLGVLLGYVVAWVLPRRREAPEGAYQAPVPERVELPADVDVTAAGWSARQRTNSPELLAPLAEGAR